MPTKNENKKKSNGLITGGVGTPIYHSPEQKNHQAYNEKVDIYALGLVLYEMCSLFNTNSERVDCLKKIKEKKEIKAIVKDNMKLESNLILMMIEDDANKRPSAEEILDSSDYIELKKINSL